MIPLRVDIGSKLSPLMAGDPLRLDVTVPGVGIEPGNVTYALFALIGDCLAPVPSFMLHAGSGITIASGPGGQLTVEMISLYTALWSGRDWHEATTVVDGRPVTLFGGLVTSTRAPGF